MTQETLKFTGSLDDLRATLTRLGYQGEWSTIDNGHQFRAANGAKLNWFPNTGRLQPQGGAAAKSKLAADLATEFALPTTGSNPAAAAAVPKEQGTARAKVFVVHGHDTLARDQLELVLHRLELDPFVLANTGGGGLTIIEALESEIGPGPGRARFGIVLMTPDDFGYSKAEGEKSVQPRARQNVVLEMGMLLAALKRPNVAILKKGISNSPPTQAAFYTFPSTIT